MSSDTQPFRMNLEGEAREHLAGHKERVAQGNQESVPFVALWQDILDYVIAHNEKFRNPAGEPTIGPEGERNKYAQTLWSVGHLDPEDEPMGADEARQRLVTLGFVGLAEDIDAELAAQEEAPQPVAESDRTWWLHGKPLSAYKRESLGYMIEAANNRPDEVIPGASETNAEALAEFKAILAFLNTKPADLPFVRNYAEPGSSFGYGDKSSLDVIKAHIAAGMANYDANTLVREEEQRFRFDFIIPELNAVSVRTTVERLAPPPADRIYPLWQWTPELRAHFENMRSFRASSFGTWEQFRTGTWRGRPNSDIGLPQGAWLLPDFDWQAWIEKVAELPIEESPAEYGPVGDAWRRPVALGYTINCNRSYGNDSFVKEKEQHAGCNQFASEFEFRGRRIVKGGNEEWFIMAEHPIAACLFTVNANPVIEWGFGIGGISTTPPDSPWRDYDWAGSPGGTWNNGKEFSGGWGWYGKERPKGEPGDIDLLMWRIHPERQPNYPDGHAGTALTFPGGDPSTMADYFGTPWVFGRVTSTFPQPLGFCEALEVCVRRVEQCEFAYGVADKPDWIDWID